MARNRANIDIGGTILQSQIGDGIRPTSAQFEIIYQLLGTSKISQDQKDFFIGVLK